MWNGGQSAAIGGDGGLRFRVFVLRDPRDGAVFWVGRCAERDQITINRGGSPVEQAAVQERLTSIRAAGSRPEQVVLADGLATESDAAMIERAVRAAYQAGQPAPNSLVRA